jgi:carboxymethylenebutenolidase
MTRTIVGLVVASALFAGCRSTESSKGSIPPSSSSLSSPAATRESLPPSEQTAKARLDASPRHGEYVDVPRSGGGKPLRAWIVYPERKEKAGVVLIVHEIYGLSDWIRGVADQLASEGFIAVAPDLVSGLGPNGGGTESVSSKDDVVKLVYQLSPEETLARIEDASRYAQSLPASNGKTASLGFGWGGGRSFEFAAASPPPQAAVVFYGTAPDSATLARVGAPVLGNYGGDDERVDATIEPARARLEQLGKSFEPHLYPGAGHGFLRAQEERNGANRVAAKQAWPRTVAFLHRALD